MTVCLAARKRKNTQHEKPLFYLAKKSIMFVDMEEDFAAEEEEEEEEEADEDEAGKELEGEGNAEANPPPVVPPPNIAPAAGLMLMKPAIPMGLAAMKGMDMLPRGLNARMWELAVGERLFIGVRTSRGLSEPLTCTCTGAEL